MNCFLFDGLNSDESEKIQAGLSEHVKADRGENIYRCGSLGIIVSGTAKIIRKNELGNSVTMRTVGAGDVFGAASVFGEWDESFSSIEAVLPCRVVYISEAELRQIFAEYPSAAMNYISFLTDRIRFLNRKIDTFSTGNSEERLYEYLVSQADADGYLNLGFGMAELARRLKIGRSSLYRGMEVLERNGLIERSKNSFKVV